MGVEAEPEGLAELKQANRATWAAGDYPAVASRMIWDVGRRIVEHADVQAGERVLDVACGTGNAAIRAAERGAEVVGADLTPELFAAGRQLAAEAGVDVEWVEGDAEALPFDTDSFDVVLSAFGCMFAPRHDVVASEIVRVTRPGGRFALASWTPEGRVGEFFRTVGAHAPPPPEFASPPPLWGDEGHVAGLFADTGVELETFRETVRFEHDSAEEGLGFYWEKFGPVIKTREALLAQGGDDSALRDDLLATFAQDADPDDGTVAYDAEYLVAIGRLPA